MGKGTQEVSTQAVNERSRAPGTFQAGELGGPRVVLHKLDSLILVNVVWEDGTC